MNFNYTEVVTEQPKKLFTAELTAESVVSEAESGGVKKILSVSAEPRIAGADYSDGGVKIYGRINFKLFYVDSADNLKNLDYFNDFSSFTPTEDVNGCKLMPIASSVEVTAKNELTTRIGARIVFDVYYSAKNVVNALLEAPDDVYSEYECGKTARFCSVLKNSAVFEDEQENRLPVDSIATFENAVVLTDAKTSDGSFRVTGKIVSTAFYLSGGEIKKAEFDIPFDDEYLNSSAKVGQSVFGNAEVKSARIVLGGEENGNRIKTEVTVDFTLWTYETEEVKFVKDLYSAKKQLQPKTESLSTGLLTGILRFDDKVSGSVTLPDDYAPVRQTVEVFGARNNVASIVQMCGLDGKNDNLKYRIEGIVVANVLYIDENGLNSVVIEIPYSQSFEAAKPCDSPLWVSGIVENAFVRIKGDRKMEVTADLVFAAGGVDSGDLNVIVDVAEGADMPQNQSAFSVFIAEDGDGVWEVAKGLCARPDEVLKENPELTFPLKSGDKAVIYRKLQAEI